MKRNCPLPFHCDSLIVGAHTITNELSVFHSGLKKYILCSSYSSLSILLCNGVSIGKYKAYWRMNFSLINGCGIHKNNVCGHSFFWSGGSMWAHQYYNCHQKSKQASIRKNCNFTINRDHSNKKVEKQGQSSIPADILVDILIPIIQLISNGLNCPVKYL